MATNEGTEGIASGEVELLLRQLRSPNACSLFAARCALRVLPYCVARDSTYFAYTEAPERHARATLAAIFGSFVEGAEVGAIAPSLAAAIAADDAADVASDAAARAAVRAAAHASTANAHRDVRAVKAAAAAYESAQDAAANAAAAVISDFGTNSFVAAAHTSSLIDRQIAEDIQILLKNQNLLRHAPLWTTAKTPEWDQRWGQMLATIASLSPDGAEILNGLMHGQNVERAMRVWLNEWYEDHEARAARDLAEGAFLGVSEKIHHDADGIEVAEHASSSLARIRVEDLATEDRLGRARYVEALQHIVCQRGDDTKPFAIGLFAEWGQGKTSFVEHLKLVLKNEPAFVVADFNAWKNEKANSHGAMLAQAVVDALTRDMGLIGKFWLAIRLQVLRHQSLFSDVAALIRQTASWFAVSDATPVLGWLGREALRGVRALLIGVAMLVPPMFIACLIVLGAALLPVADGQFHVDVVHRAYFGGIAAILFLIHQARSLVNTTVTRYFTLDNASSLFAFLRLPDYKAQRGVLGDIQATLRDLCELRLGRASERGALAPSSEVNRHLLLVIDDLDRCSIDTVKEVLDAVRLVADIPRVVTLVAIDSRMAYAAVENHYQKFGDSGRAPECVARDYLAKVFQCYLSLPKVANEDIRNLVETELFPVSSLISVPRPEADEHMDGQSGSENKMTSTPGRDIDSSRTQPTFRMPDDHEVVTIPIKPFNVAQTSWPQERDRFMKLAVAFEFGNPRQLWRMHTAWRVLKFVAVPGPYLADDVLPLMGLLFWSEWLLQQDSEKRDRHAGWLEHTEQDEHLPSSIATIMTSIRAVNRPQFPGERSLDRALELVELVLLPASPKKMRKATDLPNDKEGDLVTAD